MLNAAAGEMRWNVASEAPQHSGGCVVAGAGFFGKEQPELRKKLHYEGMNGNTDPRRSHALDTIDIYSFHMVSFHVVW